MRKLCVFYKNAEQFLGKKIKWIVCQKCQKKLHRSEYLVCPVASHTQSCGYANGKNNA